MVSPNPAPSSALRGTLISPRLFFVGSFDSRLVDLVRARGIDLGAGGRSKKARRTAPRFLVWRTEASLPRRYENGSSRARLTSRPYPSTGLSV
ncbi:unnamed protein product, partial [Musa banksii]